MEIALPLQSKCDPGKTQNLKWSNLFSFTHARETNTVYPNAMAAYSKNVTAYLQRNKFLKFHWANKFPFIIFFICLFLSAMGLRGCTSFSLVVESEGYSLVAVPRLLVAVASLVVGHRPEDTWTSVLTACGLSSCGFWALGHRPNKLRLTGLLALWHVRSSWTRDWTRVSCIGRQVLYYWAPRETRGSKFWSPKSTLQDIYIFPQGHSSSTN